MLVAPRVDDSSAGPANLYVLAVGVSLYQRVELRLKYPSKDACDLANIFKQQEGHLFEKVGTTVLVDEQATVARIKAGLVWLMKQTTDNDMAIVMLAGHGINDSRLGYCFLAVDYDPDPELLVSTVVTEGELRDLLSRIAGKRLFVIDTCHAGQLYAGQRRYRNVPDLSRFIRELQQARPTLVSLLASTGEQLAAESPEWGNGAFTKALVEGLNGGADRAKRGVVYVTPLYSYVCERVKELTHGDQTPTISMPDGVLLDFPLALTESELARHRTADELAREQAELELAGRNARNVRQRQELTRSQDVTANTEILLAPPVQLAAASLAVKKTERPPVSSSESGRLPAPVHGPPQPMTQASFITQRLPTLQKRPQSVTTLAWTRLRLLPARFGKLVAGLAVFAALAASLFGLYYLLVIRQRQSGPAAGVDVRVIVVKTEDVAPSFRAPAVVKKAEPQPLRIIGDGTVLKVVAENTAVQLNTVLVQLDSQDKFSKELTELKDRLTFYRKKLDDAKAKGKLEQERDAQQKISEKQTRLEQVEALIKNSQLLAPRVGVVSKALVKVGQEVTAGTEVVSFADKALAAEIKIPAIEAQDMKVGLAVQMSSSGGAISARISSLRTEGDYATVDFALPDDTSAKPGDELKLQKAPLSHVVRLPAAALLEGSKVYVARDGKAAVVPVTVADREGDAVLVQGLPSGEQVIIDRLEELHEGEAVRVPTATP